MHAVDMLPTFFLILDPPPLPVKPIPKRNGAIMTVCKTIRKVVASAAKAETGGVYNNTQDAVIVLIALEELRHPQPPTPIKTDNTNAHSFVHDNIKQKNLKHGTCNGTG